MLTKQEREEIAGRLKKCTCMIADSAYKALFNKEVSSRRVPRSTSRSWH